MTLHHICTRTMTSDDPCLDARLKIGDGGGRNIRLILIVMLSPYQPICLEHVAKSLASLFCCDFLALVQEGRNSRKSVHKDIYYIKAL